MPMTLEQKISLINKKRKAEGSTKTAVQRKQERRNREAEYVKKKQSHDWHSAWTSYTGQNGGPAGTRVPLFCKKCRINYQAFKVQPQSCDKFLVKDVIQ